MSAYSVNDLSGELVGTSPSSGVSSSTSKSLSKASLSTTSSSSSRSTVSTTTSVAPSASPGAFTLLGCFTDSAADRLLSGSKQSVKTNTPASCAAWCESQGYTLSGVEYASEVSSDSVALTSVLLWQHIQRHASRTNRAVLSELFWRRVAEVRRQQQDELVSIGCCKLLIADIDLSADIDSSSGSVSFLSRMYYAGWGS
jgi:hypothetical protein